MARHPTEKRSSHSFLAGESPGEIADMLRRLIGLLTFVGRVNAFSPFPVRRVQTALDSGDVHHVDAVADDSHGISGSLVLERDAPLIQIHDEGSRPLLLDLPPHRKSLDDRTFPLSFGAATDFQVARHVPDHPEQFGADARLAGEPVVVPGVGEDKRGQPFFGVKCPRAILHLVDGRVAPSLRLEQLPRQRGPSEDGRERQVSVPPTPQGLLIRPRRRPGSKSSTG
jgi:hypothetical protein